MNNHKTPVDMIVGAIHETITSGNLSILNYISAKNVMVKFINTGHELYSQADNIRKGKVKDPLSRSVSGIGYLGLGKYKLRSKGQVTKSSQTWKSMFTRCYSEKFHESNPTYIGCSVDPIWHNYQDFAKWFDQNYIEGFHLDKDILHQGNKVYSADNCLFVSQQVNNILGDNRAVRGKYKIGASFDKRREKFECCCNINGKKTHIGYYSTEEAAHQAYKKYKYAVIAEVANKQSEPLRSALLAYKIT